MKNSDPVPLREENESDEVSSKNVVETDKKKEKQCDKKKKKQIGRASCRERVSAWV